MGAQAPPRADAEALRLEGNARFARRDFPAAAAAYSAALEALGAAEGVQVGACEAGGEISARAKLLSNRSACRLALGDAEGAFADGDACALAAPAWPKAHGRKGAALTAMGDRAGAIAARRTAFELSRGAGGGAEADARQSALEAMCLAADALEVRKRLLPHQRQDMVYGNKLYRKGDIGAAEDGGAVVEELCRCAESGDELLEFAACVLLCPFAVAPELKRQFFLPGGGADVFAAVVARANGKPERALHLRSGDAGDAARQGTRGSLPEPLWTYYPRAVSPHPRHMGALYPEASHLLAAACGLANLVACHDHCGRAFDPRRALLLHDNALCALAALVTRTAECGASQRAVERCFGALMDCVRSSPEFSARLLGRSDEKTAKARVRTVTRKSEALMLDIALHRMEDAARDHGRTVDAERLQALRAREYQHRHHPDQQVDEEDALERAQEARAALDKGRVDDKARAAVEEFTSRRRKDSHILHPNPNCGGPSGSDKDGATAGEPVAMSGLAAAFRASVLGPGDGDVTGGGGGAPAGKPPSSWALPDEDEGHEARAADAGGGLGGLDSDDGSDVSGDDDAGLRPSQLLGAVVEEGSLSEERWGHLS